MTIPTAKQGISHSGNFSFAEGSISLIAVLSISAGFLIKVRLGMENDRTVWSNKIKIRFLFVSAISFMYFAFPVEQQRHWWLVLPELSLDKPFGHKSGNTPHVCDDKSYNPVTIAIVFLKCRRPLVVLFPNFSVAENQKYNLSAQLL